MRPLAADVLAVEDDAPAVGAVEAGQAVEAGRLARAVRPHDAGQRPRLEREVDRLEDDAVAEALVQSAGFEQRHRRYPAFARRARHRASASRPMPASPSGLNSTTAMNTSPYQKSQVSV